MTETDLKNLKFRLKTFMLYYQDQVYGMEATGGTKEVQIMESGVKRASGSDITSQGKESRSRKPYTPWFITEKNMTKFNNAFHALPHEVQRFIELTYGVDEHGEELLDKQVMYILRYRSTSTWKRRKKDWHQLAFNTLKNWRVI